MDNSRLKTKDTGLFQENILIFLIKIGIFLIILTPLVLAPTTLFPSMFPKGIYFRMLVEIVFCLYILLLISNRKYLPRLSWISIALIVFIEVLILSSIRGFNPYRSFWGTIERMEGLITSFHLFVFFIILIGIFREKHEWLAILRFLVLVSIVLGLAGVIQKLGIFSFYTRADSPTGGIIGPLVIYRITATLGNAVFYGSYLSLIIFLAIFLAIFEKEKFNKIFFWGLAGFNTLMLLLTSTRGAWIGVFFGVVFLVVTWLLFFNELPEKKRIAVFIIIFIVSFLFFLFLLLSEKGFLPDTNVLGRYKTIFDEAINASNSRIPVWKLGINAFKDNPLFGFGPESFSFIYDKYYQASFISLIPESIFFDRAHNKIVDTLVTSGIIGLISYVFIFTSAVFVLWRYRDENNPLSSTALIAALLAYFVQNFFAFDTISASVVLFFLFAFIEGNFRKDSSFAKASEDRSSFAKAMESRSSFAKASEGRPFLVKARVDKSAFAKVKGDKNKQETIAENSIRKYGRKLPLLIKVFSGFLIIILTIFFVFIVNIRPLTTSIEIVKGNILLNQGEVKEGLKHLDRLASISDFTNLEHLFFSTSMISLSSASTPSEKEKTSEETKLVLATLEKRAKLLEEHYDKGPDTKQMETYVLIAQLYKNLYLAEKDPKLLEDEERILGKMIKLNPQFLMSYRFAGEMRIVQNREEEGMIFLQKAYSLDKNFVTFNEWLGVALLEAGKGEKGAAALRKATKLGDFYNKGKFNLRTVWNIAYAYEEAKNYPEMAKFYEEVLQFYPEDLPPEPQIYASLATTYARIGEKEKAREVAKRMIELFPQLKGQAEEFLRSLEK